MKNKKTLIISLIVIAVVAIVFGITYSFLATTVNANRKVVLKAGTLDLILDEKNEITISDALPMYDEVGMIQEEKYNFSLVNNTSQTNEYTLKLVKIEGTNELNPAIVKYGLIKEGNTTIAPLSTLIDGVIDTGTIVGNDSIDYELRLWIDNTVTDLSTIQGKSLSYKIVAEASTVDEEATTLAAGLYDENDILVASWDELVEAGDVTVEDGTLIEHESSTYTGSKLIISEEITTISSNSIHDWNSGVTSVVLSKTVTSVEESALDADLASIVVDENNEVYDSRDNCNAIIETATNTLVQGCQNTIIPNTVTSIGQRAFGSCNYLTTITIPDSVKSIGLGAFEFCYNLESIIIPDSVTSIGQDAFFWCSELTSVYFEHETAPEFGEDCFYKEFEGSEPIICTFYFKNSTVADALIADTHYFYGTKSTDYNW